MEVNVRRQTAEDSARRIESAVQAVKSGMPYRRAAATFFIPLASLHAHVTNPNRPIQKLGRRRALRDEEEKFLVDFLVILRKQVRR